jgi:hypothetical protein
MEQVNFHINNNSGLSLLVMNNQAGNIGGCDNGGTFDYVFDSSFTNNTNAIRFYDPATPDNFIDVAGASWSAGGVGFDPGFQSFFKIAANGNYNGVPFNATQNGWIELEPWNLMANGGNVTIKRKGPPRIKHRGKCKKYKSGAKCPVFGRKKTQNFLNFNHQ